MQPIRIPTKDKGFFGAIWLWIWCVRNWTIMKDFYFTLNGEKYVIPAGFQFDGASVPKFLATFLSPVGVLLIGGLVHDYGYKYKTLLKGRQEDHDRRQGSEMDGQNIQRHQHTSEWFPSVELLGLLGIENRWIRCLERSQKKKRKNRRSELICF
jgi:hypothetical protein